MYIYEISHNITKFPYVGQSIKNEEKTKDYYGSGKLIVRAIKKYGKESFTKTILEVLQDGSSQKQLDERERFWIKKRNSKWPNGYNLTDGGSNGTGGYKFTAEDKLKISIKTRDAMLRPEVNIKLRKPRSEEGKVNIRKATKDAMYRQEVQAKIRKPKSIKIDNSKNLEQYNINRRGKAIQEFFGEEKANKIREKQRSAKLGRRWVFNAELNESKLIKQKELSDYLNRNWIAGKRRSKCQQQQV